MNTSPSVRRVRILEHAFLMHHRRLLVQLTYMLVLLVAVLSAVYVIYPLPVRFMLQARGHVLWLILATYGLLWVRWLHFRRRIQHGTFGRRHAEVCRMVEYLHGFW